MVTRFEKMKALLDRFVLGAKTVDELSLKLAKAIYKIDLSTSAVGLIVVSGEVNSFKKLGMVAATLRSTGERP